MDGVPGQGSPQGHTLQRGPHLALRLPGSHLEMLNSFTFVFVVFEQSPTGQWYLCQGLRASVHVGFYLLPPLAPKLRAGSPSYPHLGSSPVVEGPVVVRPHPLPVTGWGKGGKIPRPEGADIK